MEQELEVWKVIGDFPDYAVSNLGRVKRIVELVYHRNRLSKAGRTHHFIIRRRAGQFLKPLIHTTPRNRTGYLRIRLSINGVQAHRMVHVLVAQAFLGPCPLGMEVNHKDANGLNPAADNLEYTTRSGNAVHAFTKGCHSSGEHHRWAKLSQDDVFILRLLHGSGWFTYTTLSQIMSVHPQTIRHAVVGRSWKYGSNTGVSSCA